MIFFAAFILAAVGLVALVSDVGASRDARRRLVTATDSAALAAAQEYADGENGCNPDENDDGVVGSDEKSTAEKQLLANSSDAVMDFCEIAPGTTGGSHEVTVAAHEDVSYLLGPVVGDDSGTSYSSTTVLYGRPSGIVGVRPLAFCYDQPELLDWMSKGYPSPSEEYTIYFESNIAMCGDPAGNWGLLDLNGGSNSTPEFNAWMANGFEQMVDIGTIIEGKTGAPAGGKYIGYGVGQVIEVPIVEHIGTSGSNSLFNVMGFVSGEITDVVDYGSQSSRHIKFKFHSQAVDGPCCSESTGGPTGGYYGLVAYVICGVDDDTASC